MNESTIWKYPLIPGPQGIEMPEGAIILSAQMQGRDPQLWVQVKPSRAKATRRIAVVGTGHAAPDDAKFIATFQIGPLVWHVFDGGYVTPSQGVTMEKP
jgi:hypothetical protein